MSRLSLCEQGLTPPGNSGTYLRIALRRGDGAGVDPPVPLCHWLRADPGRTGLIPLHFQVEFPEAAQSLPQRVAGACRWK